MIFSLLGGEIQGGGSACGGGIFKGVGKHFFWNRGQNTVQGFSLATILYSRAFFLILGVLEKYE